jgi:protein TonB
MKTKQFFHCALWILAFVLAVSCAKQELSAPAEKQSASPHYKDAPDLISSRQDYALLDVSPSFPGGDSLLTKYLNENIRYPRDARDNHISGKVFASVIIENDGSLSNLEILRGLGYGCDDAVLGALRDMPAWSPGAINGRSVRVKLVIPVEFRSL